MAAPADLDPLPDRLRLRARDRRFANGVGQCLEVVRGGLLARRERQPDDVPSSGRGEAVRVRAAQVVAVRLDVGGQRPEYCRRVPVDVGQRAHSVPLARWPGAAARTQRPTSLTAPIATPGRTRCRSERDTGLDEQSGLRAPVKARPRRSLTTADGIGSQGGNAITRGTLRDRVLASTATCAADGSEGVTERALMVYAV